MAQTIRPDELKALLSGNLSPTVLDVRRRADHEANPQKIKDATWLDPEKIDEWIRSLPAEKQTVVYCVKGGSVSRSVSDRLEQEGFDVTYLEGGLKAWLDSGNNVG